MAFPNSKPLTEFEMRNFLRAGGLALPPASFQTLEEDVLIPFNNDGKPEESRGRLRADGIVEACWQGCSERFVVEYKAHSTPKALDTVISQAVRYGQSLNLPPLIVVPFLSEEQLRVLEAQRVSGIDLCGNGVLIGEQFLLWRSGAPNRFKDSQPIKNVFRGSSSLYARCFLLRPQFDSLAGLRSFALWRLERGLPTVSGSARLVLSTASKVVQALEEEQIVFRDERHPHGLRNVNPKRLLEQLKKNYQRSLGPRLEGKPSLSTAEVWQRLTVSAQGGGLRAVATGLGSAGHYGALSGPDRMTLYVSDLKAAASLLEVQGTRVFPNIELVEEKSDTAYFDAREQGQTWWASPIQTWLELATGNAREQEAAQRLETRLLQARAEEWE